MKRTFLITALFLGFSVVGFSQPSETFYAVKSDFYGKGQIKVVDETGKEGILVIKNSAVTIIPGEAITIHIDGAAVNARGVYIGHTPAFSLLFQVSEGSSDPKK